MSPDLLPKIEAVGEVFQLASGALVIRPKGGRRLKLGKFARTALQVDGSVVLTPYDDFIETDEAMEILNVPWSTLRRFIEDGAVVAHKRSPSRWVVSVESCFKLRTARQSDPEFWENFEASKPLVQAPLNLG